MNKTFKTSNKYQNNSLNINTISTNKIIFAKLKYLMYNKRVVNYYAMAELSKMQSE